MKRRRNPLKCCTGGVPCDDPPPPSPLLHLEGETVNISLSVYIRETPPEIPPWQDTRLPEIKDDQKKVFLHVECHLQKRTTEYFVLQF